VTDNKRLRMAKDELENILFALFEKQTTWNFSQLQRETDQPAPWLKVSDAMCRVFRLLGVRMNGARARRVHCKAFQRCSRCGCMCAKTCNDFPGQRRRRC